MQYNPGDQRLLTFNFGFHPCLLHSQFFKILKGVDGKHSKFLTQNLF